MTSGVINGLKSLSDFFLNNKPVALIIQIYPVIKLYLPIIEFSTVHSALVSFMQVYDDRELLMMGREVARNM
jgi:hypothetical protein